MDFAVPVDQRVKLKESENRHRLLDLAIELKKKLWKMNVMMVIVIAVLRKNHKGLVKGLEELGITGKMETI